MKIQVSELLVKFLHRLGVDTLFGMPGAHILPVYDDLYASGIQTVLVKHEQGAAFMAGGYARVSGRIGACITTAGPGASNLITGIANAYADKLPVLVITGEAPTYIFGRGGLQESSGEGGSIDQTALFEADARFQTAAVRADHYDFIYATLAELLARPGGVDAVFCSSDMLALGVMVEAQARGIRVPDQLGVVGLGDLEFAANLEPALTTVRIDGTRIGETAARYIVDRAEGRTVDQPILDIGFSIIERGSA